MDKSTAFIILCSIMIIASLIAMKGLELFDRDRVQRIEETNVVTVQAIIYIEPIILTLRLRTRSKVGWGREANPALIPAARLTFDVELEY